MKRISFILMIMLALLGTTAQRSEAREIKDFFISMPNELMLMLDEGTRRDLVDICLSGMHTALPNKWQGNSTMSILTEDFLSMFEDSEYHVHTCMALLYGKKDTTLCVIRTLNTPEQASDIRFYDTSWRELKTGKIVKLPETDDFGHDEQKVAANPLRVELLRIGITVVGDHTAHLEMSTNTSAHSIFYDWNGKRFVKRKE